MELLADGYDMFSLQNYKSTFQWRYNERDGISNHRCLDCLLKCLFRRRSNKTPKLRVIGLCEGNSPVTSELPTQRASNAENVSTWWRHHETIQTEILDSWNFFLRHFEKLLASDEDSIKMTTFSFQRWQWTCMAWDCADIIPVSTTHRYQRLFIQISLLNLLTN